MFPSINTSNCPDSPWKETLYPDHGEVWSIPWISLSNHEMPGGKSSSVVEIETESGIEISASYKVHGIRFPYSLEKTITLEDEKIIISYNAENLSPFPLPFLWAAHALFQLETGMRLVPPDDCDEIFNALEGKLGKVGDVHTFPETLDSKGNKLDLSLIPEKNSWRL